MPRPHSFAHRICQLALGCTLLAGSALMAAAPIAPADIGPAADLEAEAVAKTSELEAIVASEEAYEAGKEKVRQAATVLTCLAQALAEHSDAGDVAAKGPGIRDAAKALAGTKDLATARAAFAEVKKAWEEAQAGAAVEFDWAKLGNMHATMEEMNSRSAALRKALKRSKDAAVESRHALTIAVLAVATHADTHEVKSDDDKPQWYEWAAELQEHFSATSAAIKAKDTKLANIHFAKGMETCEQCHGEFKD